MPDHEATGTSGTKTSQGAKDHMPASSHGGMHTKAKPPSSALMEPKKTSAPSRAVVAPVVPKQHSKSSAQTALILIPSQCMLPPLAPVLMVPQQLMRQADLIVASMPRAPIFGTNGIPARPGPSLVSTPSGSAPPLSSDEEEEDDAGLYIPRHSFPKSGHSQHQTSAGIQGWQAQPWVCLL